MYLEKLKLKYRKYHEGGRTGGRGVEALGALQMQVAKSSEDVKAERGLGARSFR